VVEWAGPFGDDWARAWNECPRGDWLLGIAAKAGVDRARLVSAACACAGEALAYVPDDEPRPGLAIDAAASWVTERGEAWRAALVPVQRCADEAPDPAVATAATAAAAALRCIESPEDAPLTAAAAAQAAVHDAGDCGMMSALGYVQSRCAEHVRDHIPIDDVLKRLG